MRNDIVKVHPQLNSFKSGSFFFGVNASVTQRVREYTNAAIEAYNLSKDFA